MFPLLSMSDIPGYSLAALAMWIIAFWWLALILLVVAILIWIFVMPYARIVGFLLFVYFLISMAAGMIH